MKLKRILQHRYALSSQGATDLMKACLASCATYIVLMMPVGLLYYLVADLIQGGHPLSVQRNLLCHVCGKWNPARNAGRTITEIAAFVLRKERPGRPHQQNDGRLCHPRDSIFPLYSSVFRQFALAHPYLCGPFPLRLATGFGRIVALTGVLCHHGLCAEVAKPVRSAADGGQDGLRRRHTRVLGSPSRPTGE